MFGCAGLGVDIKSHSAVLVEQGANEAPHMDANHIIEQCDFYQKHAQTKPSHAALVLLTISSVAVLQYRVPQVHCAQCALCDAITEL